MPGFLKVAQVVLEFLVPSAGAGVPLAITGVPPSGQVGVAYGFCFTASGGTPPYVDYSITVGSLPPGLTLGALTGCLTGTPTASGTFCFTVTVTDSAAGTASVDACITIFGSVIILLMGWKLYPEAPCDDAIEGVEIPSIKRAI